MFVGATSSMIAVSRCAGVSEASSARAASSWLPNGRRPFLGPSMTSAGLAAKKVGVLTLRLPSMIVKCSER